jgi:SET domain-containing protein
VGQSDRFLSVAIRRMTETSVVQSKTEGRGVIADRAFSKDEIVEFAPVLVLSSLDIGKIEDTGLARYWYEWDDDGTCAIVMGCGSFYNHSFNPNLDFDRHFDQLAMSYTALRAIGKGEELTINYNGILECNDPVGFAIKS